MISWGSACPAHGQAQILPGISPESSAAPLPPTRLQSFLDLKIQLKIMTWPCLLAKLWLQGITSLVIPAEGIKILHQSRAEPGQGTAGRVSLLWECCWTLSSEFSLKQSLAVPHLCRHPLPHLREDRDPAEDNCRFIPCKGKARLSLKPQSCSWCRFWGGFPHSTP